jgi:hypothetical protein
VSAASQRHHSSRSCTRRTNLNGAKSMKAAKAWSGVTNPFKPTAGANPPLLVGRDELIDEFAESIEDGPGAPMRLRRTPQQLARRKSLQPAHRPGRRC